MSEQQKADGATIAAELAQKCASIAKAAAKGNTIHFVNLAHTFNELAEKLNAIAAGVYPAE